jgi:hypothetical protein
MRSAISVRFAPILTVMVLVCALIPAARGNDVPEADERREVGLEWRSLAKGRTEFDVSDPALLPNRLVLAIEQSGCRYKEGIAELPVHFINGKQHRFALVFCFDISSGSHQVFDLWDLRKPQLVELPSVARPNGFTTTDRPGVITWNKESAVFQAETGSDLLPSPRLRQTYRLDETRSRVTFVITRVEVRPDGHGEWVTMWDAPQWSVPAKPSAR